jgi:hypothetical protein
VFSLCVQLRLVLLALLEVLVAKWQQVNGEERCLVVSEEKRLVEVGARGKKNVLDENRCANPYDDYHTEEKDAFQLAGEVHLI